MSILPRARRTRKAGPRPAARIAVTTRSYVASHGREPRMDARGIWTFDILKDGAIIDRVFYFESLRKTLAYAKRLALALDGDTIAIKG